MNLHNHPMNKKDARMLQSYANALRNCGMTKEDALRLLECDNDLSLSKAIGVSHTTVGRWMDPLPTHAVIRVVDSLPSAG